METRKWKVRKLNKVNETLATNRVDYDKKFKWMHALYFKQLQAEKRTYAAYYKKKGAAACHFFRENSQRDSCKLVNLDNCTLVKID